MSNLLQDLHSTLQKRARPEDVAELIRQAIASSLNKKETTILDRAAQGSIARNQGLFSSMSTEFAKPVGAQRQVRRAKELFPGVRAIVGKSCDVPVKVNQYIARAGRVIAKEVGKSDFKTDRLNRNARVNAGLGDLSKRQYNKRFRLLTRMERKVAVLEREIEKRECTLVSKSRFASRILVEDFCQNPDTACFVAYLTARCNLRSVFTNTSQERPYDEIADMLFARCRRNKETNWWVIAQVHPDQEVLSRLTDEQKGNLLAKWFEMLNKIANLLRDVWEKSRFDRTSMIVRRGDDSTTWNATAGAWNKARESWIGLLHALGMEDVLDELCPGKVLRLMAADVAAWHRASGGGLEPDTAVWAALPPPWEVLDGTASCTREEVEAICRRLKVDPVKKGWTSPRPDRVVAKFRATPELVHGVEVGHPGLAVLLRRMGVFSGKKLKSLPE